MSASIEITGMAELEAALGKAIRMLENPQPMLTEVGNALVSSTKGRFEQEVDPQGNEWKLKDSTIKQKQKSGFTKKLQRTGNLKNSITRRIATRKLEIGTPLEYGKYLQKGTSKMEGKEFLGVSEEDKQVIEDITEKHVRKAFS